MKTTVEIGKELEQYIANKFQEVGFKYARRSKGSGNRGELGDIAGQDIIICECKKKSSKNLIINEAVWNKVLNSIPLKSERFPVYFLENQNKVRLAVLDVDQFFKLIDGWLNEQKEKRQSRR